MSAILSADDLNDFINPGVACIKPIEVLPKQQPQDESNPYEVTTEEKVNAGTAPPAQISLTDCLACAGCVTSAEAVLVSLQSHNEVLETLDRHTELRASWSRNKVVNDTQDSVHSSDDAKIFIASVSPQTRASLAATYNVSEREAGNMISHLLTGPYGLRSGGKHGSGFAWVVDTNVMREACLVASADEAQQTMASPSDGQKKPVLTSACPGWICYVEKGHPHVLPHLSKLKSPQALTGTLLKSILAKKFGIPPEQIWHLAVMPCFDKKLEASRSELTSHTWHGQDGDAVRDVDCVITARELLMLAESRNISFPCLPRRPVERQYAPSFPDTTVSKFLFGRNGCRNRKRTDEPTSIGTSGGYLHYVLKTQQAQHPGSSISTQPGRNADVSEYLLRDPSGAVIFRAARYYGFRNITNLVRRLQPAKASRVPGAARRPGGARKPGPASSAGGADAEFAYVEVMACPGGCTNGGGQVKIGDVATLRQVGGTGVVNGSLEQEVLPAQKEWLAKVDEAYWSADSDELDGTDLDVDADGDSSMAEDSPATTADADMVDGIDQGHIKHVLHHWANSVGVGLDRLLYTTYRAVESDVGKDKKPATEVDKISALAVAQGSSW